MAGLETLSKKVKLVIADVDPCQFFRPKKIKIVVGEKDYAKKDRDERSALGLTPV